MDIFFVFIKGFVIGLSIASLIGPISVLCIKKTLERGRLSGFLSGLGAAVADGLYGSIAAFGLVVIMNFLDGYNSLLKLFGGLFLIYLGVKGISKSSKVKSLKVNNNKSLLNDFVSTFFLTLTNPATIFLFMGVFAGLGIAGYDKTFLSIVMVFGVFFGSLVWYYMLTYVINMIGHKLSEKSIHYINVISGFIILSFGIISLLGLVF